MLGRGGEGQSRVVWRKKKAGEDDGRSNLTCLLGSRSWQFSTHCKRLPRQRHYKLSRRCVCRLRASFPFSPPFVFVKNRFFPLSVVSLSTGASRGGDRDFQAKRRGRGYNRTRAFEETEEGGNRRTLTKDGEEVESDRVGFGYREWRNRRGREGGREVRGSDAEKVKRRNEKINPAAARSPPPPPPHPSSPSSQPTTSSSSPQ